MAAEIKTINESRDENKEKLKNGKRTLPEISSALILDSYFDERSCNLNDFFEHDELGKVSDLSIQDNCLSSLPYNFGKNLSNLIKINLSYNNMQELDVCLKTLKNLEELRIDKNGLAELPNYLGELYNLRLISAKGNKLKIVPECLGNLGNLEELDFSHNAIRNISGSWAGLKNLRKLNLAYNELRSTPSCVTQGSPRLEILDLSQNCISEFSQAPLSNNLRQLYLNNNSRNDLFPAWLITEKFSSLEELVLDETAFAAFALPPKTSPLSNLRKLSMVQTGLSDTDLGRISQSFINLEYLNVGNKSSGHGANSFWVLPAQSLVNPETLNELSIQGTGLPAVPQEINSLRNLTRLNVSQNNVSSLPEEICELNRLEFLNAAGNNLYALPQGLGNLKALKIVFLESNKLSSLPDSIENLDCLECLDLYNNEFLQIPEQLARIPNLKALDIDGNVFKTDNLQIAEFKYQKAKNLLRSTRNLLMLRSNDPKVLDEADDRSLSSSLDYEDDHRNVETKSLIDANLSDIVSEENWSISEDSADEFDPTMKPRNYIEHSPFTVSSVFYYGNFCPADLHSTRVKDQLAAMQAQHSRNIEEGQFDDA